MRRELSANTASPATRAPARRWPYIEWAGTCIKVTRPMMTNAETLADLIHKHRGVKRVVSYLEGENNERVVGYAELYERALGILYHLQKLGAKPGDKLILYLSNNEQFLDAFWAGMLG